MRLARILRWLTRLRRIQPRVGAVHARLLRRARGRIRRSLVFAGGQPVLALSSTGRRTGQRRTTVVAYVRHADSYAVAALNLGADHHPAWYLNLRADPRGQVYVDGREVAVQAREATDDEAAELWDRFIAQLSQIRHSRAIARREVPILVLEPTRAPAG